MSLHADYCCCFYFIFLQASFSKITEVYVDLLIIEGTEFISTYLKGLLPKPVKSILLIVEKK